MFLNKMNNTSTKPCSLYFTEKKCPESVLLPHFQTRCKMVQVPFFGIPKSSVDTWTEIVLKVNGYI